MNRIRLPRRLALGVAVAAAICLSSGPEVGATPIVVVDAGAITLKTGDDGRPIGMVTLLNLTDSKVTLTASVGSDPESGVAVDPQALDPGRRHEVTLIFAKDYRPAAGAVVTLEYTQNGVTTNDVVPVKWAETSMNWQLLGLSFLIGFAVSLVVLAVTFARMELKKNLELEQRLEHLGTDWTFKDNWVSTISLGSSVLVALLGTSSVLQAIIGSEPAGGAMGLLAVVAAMSGLLVAIGPLFLKVIGGDTSVPTILGVLVAGFVTLGAVLAQIVALTWQGAELTGAYTTARVVVVLVGVIFGGVILWYAITQLWRIILTGVTPPKDVASGEEKALWEVSRAIRGHTARLPERGPAGDEEPPVQRPPKHNGLL